MEDKPDPLATWQGLNAWITYQYDEPVLQALLDRELAGKRRQQFVLRIHSRLNRIRADRERAELLVRLKSPVGA